MPTMKATEISGPDGGPVPIGDGKAALEELMKRFEGMASRFTAPPSAPDEAPNEGSEGAN